MPAKKKNVAVSYKTGSRQLSAYFRSYSKNGNKDPHFSIFSSLKAIVKPKTVLYPGCYRHITPSLFFPDVHYVDSDRRVAGIYNDTKAYAFIESNKIYSGKQRIKFTCKDYTTEIQEVGGVDLLISLSAGLVSKFCGKYVKPGGYLFVNDSHSDARTASLDSRFELVGVYDENLEEFVQDKQELLKHFTTVSGEPISQDQVEESIKKSKARRHFKLQAESMFYLYRRKAAQLERAEAKSDASNLRKARLSLE